MAGPPNVILLGGTAGALYPAERRQAAMAGIDRSLTRQGLRLQLGIDQTRIAGNGRICCSNA